MPKYAPTLDDVFKALSDPTRRAVISRLAQGPAAVSELAEPFDMALPSFTQHLQVLEKCGLVASAKQGRRRYYHVAPDRLELAENWLAEQRSLWERRLDQLDDFLLALERKGRGT